MGCKTMLFCSSLIVVKNFYGFSNLLVYSWNIEIEIVGDVAFPSLVAVENSCGFSNLLGFFCDVELRSPRAVAFPSLP